MANSKASHPPSSNPKQPNMELTVGTSIQLIAIIVAALWIYDNWVKAA